MFTVGRQAWTEKRQCMWGTMVNPVCILGDPFDSFQQTTVTNVFVDILIFCFHHLLGRTVPLLFQIS